MAERIDITIGSSADLSGFQKANKAAQELGRAGKRAKEALGEVSSSLQQFGGPVAVAVKGIENMSKAIEAFGAAGAIIGGAKLALDAYAWHAQEAAKKLKELMDQMSVRSDARLQDAVARHIDQVKIAVDALSEGARKSREDFEKVEAAATKVAVIMGRINAAEARGTLADIHVEKLNALVDAESEEAKKVIEAQYNLRLATEKARQTEEAQTQAIQAAQKAIDNKTHSLKLAQKEVSEAESVYALATKKLEEARSSGLTAQQGLTKFELEASRAEAALTKAKNDEEKITRELTESSANLKLAQAEAAANRKQSDVEVLAATHQLADAEEAAATALIKQAEATEKAQLATEMRAKAEAEAAQAEREIKQGAKARDVALKAELADLEKRISDAEKSAEKSRAGMNADKRVSDFGPAYQYDLDKNGNINDFVDWQRAQRFGGRAERDQRTADRVNAAQEKKAADLQKKLDEGKRLGENEKKFLDDWRKFNDERNRAKLQEQAKELNKQIAANTKKMADDLRQVKENLKTALEVK